MIIPQNILDGAQKCIDDYGIIGLSKKSGIDYKPLKKAIDTKECKASTLKKLLLGIKKCNKETEKLLTDLN